MKLVNKPRVSKFIVGTYMFFAVFITVLIAFFAYASFFTPLGIIGLAAVAVSIFVEVIMLVILASIHRTQYVLTKDELLIRATRLIGGSKHIHLRDVDHVKKTLIPFSIRLFGASFHGGYYQIPSLGRVFMVITNFEDGVLIQTKHENYIITPRKPEEFSEAINNARRSLSVVLDRRRGDAFNPNWTDIDHCKLFKKQHPTFLGSFTAL
jgi:hypothetical protein